MYGFNAVTLDKKGRLLVPARYRDVLQLQKLNKIVITKDPQYPSLKVYNSSEWEQISKKLESLQGLSLIHI